MAVDTKPMETRIQGLINKVATGEMKPVDSGVATALNTLKQYDEAAYEVLLDKYKKALITAKR